MRIIRLAVGLYTFYEAIKTPDILLISMASILTIMALLNVGCGAQGCGIPRSQHTTENIEKEEIEYEEVK
ncbi:MAG: hypothetical protein RJA76_1616 [Bacteroidota bacterium]